jgi:hypothetical protein
MRKNFYNKTLIKLYAPIYYNSVREYTTVVEFTMQNT